MTTFYAGSKSERYEDDAYSEFDYGQSRSKGNRNKHERSEKRINKELRGF